jgi:hypothetical protein
MKVKEMRDRLGTYQVAEQQNIVAKGSIDLEQAIILGVVSQSSTSKVQNSRRRPDCVSKTI